MPGKRWALKACACEEAEDVEAHIIKRHLLSRKERLWAISNPKTKLSSSFGGNLGLRNVVKDK